LVIQKLISLFFVHIKITMTDIQQLLPIEYTRDIHYEKVIIGKIHKSKVNLALDYLKTVKEYQNDNLEHLKRVNKHPSENNSLNILICLEKV